MRSKKFVQLLNKAFPDLQRNSKLYLVVLFILIVGISSGIVTPRMLGGSYRENCTLYLNAFFDNYTSVAIDYAAVLVQSLLGNMLLSIIICACGIWPAIIPLSMLALMFRGFTLGFASVIIILSFGAGGIIIIMACILLPAMILLPCYIRLSVIAASRVSLRIEAGIKKLRVYNDAKNYLFSIGKVFSFMLIGIFIESVIVPLIFKAVSNLI